MTPPLSDHILASITRAQVIQLVNAGERSCMLVELKAADEAFIASTAREVQDVAAIDDRVFEQPGPVFARTAQAFSDYVAREMAHGDGLAAEPGRAPTHGHATGLERA
jgi:branched-chain amino acid aminotransferase